MIERTPADAFPGELLSSEEARELASWLKEGEDAIEGGDFIRHDELAARLEAWRARKRKA